MNAVADTVTPPGFSTQMGTVVKSNCVLMSLRFNLPSWYS